MFLLLGSLSICFVRHKRFSLIQCMNKAWQYTMTFSPYLLQLSQCSTCVRRDIYISHLILPQHKYNTRTPYNNHIVGMCPEVMPLDAHLNQDIHKSVNQYVNPIFTSNLIATQKKLGNT